MSEQLFSIPIERISATEDYLIRFDNVDDSGVNTKYLNDLKSSDPSNWPPIAVIWDGGNRYFLVDGYHRLMAAKAMKLKTIVGFILPNADRETAFNLNREHGLRLTINDRKEHACWLHEHYPALSGREIARRTGLDHATVNKALTQGDGENHQLNGISSSNVIPLSISRASAARAILRYMEKLWITRGLRANFDRERAVSELAEALREQSELSPDYKLYLQVLKAVVNLATAKAANKSH